MSEADARPDPNLTAAAIYANSYRAVDPWVGSTGMRTYPLRHGTLGDGAAHRRIAEEFLVNSRLRRGDPEFALSVGSYFTDPAKVMLSLLGTEEPVGLRQVALPSGTRMAMALGEALRRRRSVRSYSGDPMPLSQLATIIRAAAGVTAREDVALDSGGRVTLTFRSSPSGGGLYPIDLHVAALKVQSLERGLFRYDPLRDVLWQTGEAAELQALLRAVALPDEVVSISLANAVFLLVGRPWRTMRKYGDRGMRLLFLEAGAMAAHVNLAAVALGFGSVDFASIYDDEAHDALGVDGLYQTLVHAVVVGAAG